MKSTIRGMQEKRARGEKGFTLIELLVVVVIIGVLVAIAIPLYLNYRKGAANKSAQSDVRGAITAVEQYYTSNNNVYPGVVNVNQTSVAAGLVFVGQTATVSPNNSLVYKHVDPAVGANFYVICGWNPDGAVVYKYRSDQGGSVKSTTEATPALCADAVV